MEKTTEQTTETTAETLQRTNTAADTYIERRTLTTGETFTATIQDLGFQPETDTLHFFTHINNRHIKLSVNLTDPPENAHKFLSSIFITNNREINESLPKQETIQVTFDKNIQTCLHVDTGCEITFTETDANAAETHTLTQEFTTELKHALRTSKYNDPNIQAHNSHSGIILPINAVENNSETLTVTVTPTIGTAIEWTVQIPTLTEMETSPQAIFIENQGGGDPRHIDTAGKAVIIHDSDMPSNLDDIGLNNNHNWNLIPPTVFADWCDKEAESEVPKQIKTTTAKFPPANPTPPSPDHIPVDCSMRQDRMPWANKNSYLARSKSNVTNSVVRNNKQKTHAQ